MLERKSLWLVWGVVVMVLGGGWWGSGRGEAVEQAVVRETRLAGGGWSGAIFGKAGDECINTVSITPSDADIVGDIHSNGDIHSGGGTITTVDGIVSCSGGSGCTSGGFYAPGGGRIMPQEIPWLSDPWNHDVSEFAPGGAAATVASGRGEYYYPGPGIDIDRTWLVANSLLVPNTGSDAAIYPQILLPGLYFSDGDIDVLMGSIGTKAEGVTMVAGNEVRVSGSELRWTAYDVSVSRGMVLFAAKVQPIGGASCSSHIINLSGSNIEFVGSIYGRYGGVNISASSKGDVQGNIVGYTISLSGSQIDVVYDPSYWIPTNEPPVAMDDAYVTVEGVPLTVMATGVLSNDMDTEGITLTAMLVDGVGIGVLDLQATGAFTYTPPIGFQGEVWFTYRAIDDLSESNLATVIVQVVGACPLGIGTGVAVCIRGGGNDVVLDWEDNPSAVGGYEVHRSVVPYFMPASGTLVESLPAGSWAYLDAGKLEDSATNYYYYIVPLGCGSCAATSNHVAEFDFDVVVGTP